ncbi:DUF6090 family protein [Marinigracilibium pacificum]|uniref:Uncharacterized protein n=1 Tax=Marinigracilibium pacificum TaxID=2729599 RepID=A0A848J027_9BACT|nr:DUF6090 family protein [Marinigracilibium pacificum]NMM49897.1 hypothetical protein [Marinigracilibium pacificum]
MITVFRKIRQKLLHENRFTRYLIYALGEIILVVIGILIALQINNMNSQRIDREKEQAYLLELKANLIQDSLSLTEVKNFNKIKKKSIYSLLQIFNDTLTNYDRIQIFAQNTQVFTDYRVFEPISTTYSNMLSAESIAIIRDNDLKKLLSEYYGHDYKHGVQERIIMMNRYVVDEFFPEFTTREMVQRSLKLSTELPEIKDLEIHKNQRLFSNLHGILYILDYQNNMLSKTMNLNQQLIKNINESLNDKN